MRNGHTHGRNKRRLKIRCGINEGLCILNLKAPFLVTHLFTDGLVNCCQVIWRSNNATFTTHISGDAPHPETFIWMCLRQFNFKYNSAITSCYVASGDDPDLGNRIHDYLRRRLHCNVERIRNTGGCCINMLNGDVSNTPVMGSGPNRDDVAGYLTASDLIDLRLTDSYATGEPGYGDYYEGCQLCNTL